MDGDIPARRRPPQLGEGWGYSATIPAELAHPQGVVARDPTARADTARKDKGAEDRTDKDGKNKAEDGKQDTEGRDGGDKPTPKPMPRWKKALYTLVALIVLGALAVAGTLYWLHARQFETTDDAFVDGYMSQVSAQVAAKVLRLGFRDNDEVKAGQVLLNLDPRDYQVKLDSARAQRAQAQAQLDQAGADLLVRKANLDQSQAQVRVSQADLGQQQTDLNRYRAIDPKAITRQQLDTSSAQTRAAAARLDASQQAVAGAAAQVKAQEAQVEAAAANVRAADVAVANAELQLSYTAVLAPQDGRVTRRSVDVGNYVNPGQALLSVVSNELWVTANFKETQLAAMTRGQHVRVGLDACPGKSFDAHVDSFQAGTGAVFSSLPAENATGNYVKVVQRVPVKIVFDGPLNDCRIAPGLSVSPRVTVR